MPKIDLDAFDTLEDFNHIAALDEPLDSLLTMALGIVQGVEWVHRLNFVVGDLKPDNILLHESGVPVAFIDTDSFCVADDSGSLVYARRALTERYRAAEIRVGDWPSFESDRFALAIMVLELIFAGTHPFQYVKGDADDDIQGRIDSGNSWLFSPDEFCAPSGHPGVEVLPRALQDLARRGLGAAPSGRPEAAEWLKQLLLVEVEACDRSSEHAVLKGGRCASCATENVASGAELTDRTRTILAGLRSKADPANARRRAVVVGAALLLVLLVIFLATRLL